MKIPELKLAIANHSKDDLAYLLVELYKQVPKAKKEDNEIDAMILAGKPATGETKVKKTPQMKTFAFIKSEVDEFVNHATKQHYLGKDRAIAKKDRPKWRFTCRALLKDLFDNFQQEKENRVDCVNALEQLYQILSIGGNYHYFSAEDTFASVGYEHETLCSDIIKLYFQTFPLKSAAEKAVELLLIGADAPNAYFPSRCGHFLGIIKDDDSKLEALVTTAKIKTIEVNQKIDDLLAAKERKKNYSNNDFSITYAMKEGNANLIYLIFNVMFLLEEEEEAITYYHENIRKYSEDKEIQLYVLSGYLIRNNAHNLAVKEIERAVEKGISPRASLVKLHKDILNGIKNIYI
jgi:hypothetical protein